MSSSTQSHRSQGHFKVLDKIGIFSSVLAVTIPLSSSALNSQSQIAVPRTEYELKAFFMVNFSRYIEWPEDRRNEKFDIEIGILGKDPFGSSIDFYAGQSIKKHKVIVKRSSNYSDLKSCRIVFIGKGIPDVENIIKEAKFGNTLIFGESDDFLKVGGMVRFVVRDKNVKLQVSKRAFLEANLTISSYLLAISEVLD